MRQVTSWADKGTTPDLKSGRWVMLGKNTLINYWLTGLPGGKFYVTNNYPFITYEKNKSCFENSVTAFVEVQWPKGFGLGGYYQRSYRSTYCEMK